MAKFLRIDPSGDLSWVEIEPGAWFPALYDSIGCDCVEQVHTVIRNIAIVIDESGKVKREPQKHNELASKLYYGYLSGVDHIVGPAVVVALERVGPFMELGWVPLDERQLAILSLHLGIKIPEA